MSTLNQLIYNVRNVPDVGIANRAKAISDRQIAYWIKYHRSSLINEDLELNPVIDASWEQDFGCLDLVTVDKADCSKYKWGVDVKKVVIPQLIKVSINRKYGIIPSLTFVGLIDKVTRIPIDLHGYGELDEFVMHSPKKGIYALLIGNTIYIHGIEKGYDIVNEDELCAINVRGLADDPTCIDCCGSDGIVSCFDWDKDCYPLPGHLESKLFARIWQRELGLVMNSNQDNTNNEKTEKGV